MKHPNGPVIDMTPDGRFIEPPKPSLLAYVLRLALFGISLVTVVILFWTFLRLLPLFILAGVVSYFLFRPHIRFRRF